GPTYEGRAHLRCSCLTFRYASPAAFLDIALSAAVILSTISARTPSPCRWTIQLGSLYESHVLPAASCQTSAFNGRSIPAVWDACINGVPPRALPKMMRLVGRKSSPASAAPPA